jgi:hypothetical protein
MGTTRRLPTPSRESRRSLVNNASVPLEAASELVGVQIGQIRGWAENGSIEIERRGDLEVVHLDAVEALAHPRHVAHRDRCYMLRRLLDGITLETQSVLELQQLARERELAPAS